jgi:hypothetical protein
MNDRSANQTAPDLPLSEARHRGKLAFLVQWMIDNEAKRTKNLLPEHSGASDIGERCIF